VANLDPITLIIAYLKSQTAITNLVGSGTSARVYGEILPADFTIQKAIVVSSPGGQPSVYTEGKKAIVYIKSYDVTSAGASALDLVVYSALHNKGRLTTGANSIQCSLQTVMAQSTPDPDVNWACKFSIYEIQI
jgi:hypothetical protein